MGTLQNPNMWPRPLATWIAGKVLGPWLGFLRVKPKGPPLPPAAFQSYFVGDLFMALPALKLLAREFPQAQVLCRPDCVGLVRAEGLAALPFDNSFCTKPGLKTFIRTFRSAWALRGQIGPALDMDADSRTGLWMKIAGSARTISFNRPRAAFFDKLYPLPRDAIHQSTRCLTVVRGFFRDNSRNAEVDLDAPPWRPGAPEAPWIISCWTRLDVKNWPLDRWEIFLEKMLAAGESFRIIEPPDGDALFKAFRSRWESRVPFLKVSLNQIAAEIQSSKGVVATDNFVGHMAGYYGKPVLWINGSSDETHVLPLGPLTRYVQFEPMPCRPCIHNCVNPEYKACLNHLEVDPVWRAFEALRASASPS